MRLAALFSGGKDSTYSIFLAERSGHVVEVLLTFVPQSVDSYMFHYPNIHLTPLQAEVMRKKQLIYPIGGRREEEVLDNALAEVASEVDGLVYGVVASSYQRSRVQKAAEKHGLETLTPLWSVDPEALLRRVLADGFSAMVVAVAAAGLGKEWLGRILDDRAVDALAELRRSMGVNPAGEGGEFETFVLDCPLFRKRIVPRKTTVDWRGSYGYLFIENVDLVEKT